MKNKKVVETNETDCLCGCGEIPKTGGLFRPGHDAKLRSMVIKVANGEASAHTIPQVAVMRRKSIQFLKKDRKLMSVVAKIA